MSGALDPVDRGQVARRIWELSREFRGEANPLGEHPYAFYRAAKRDYDRARAKALLRAPIRDPNEPTRKMNAEDREAWVETQPEVMEALDELVLREITWKHHDEQVWGRKSELEALRTLSADARAELNSQ